MFTAHVPIILASASPRRQQFLNQMGISFKSIPAVIDETPLANEAPQRFAERMAKAKASSISENNPQACIIGADTVVTCDNKIFGKPGDAEDALHTLKYLQGKTHKVITGVAVFFPSKALYYCGSETTLVTFDTFTDAALQAYIHCGEPMDKAGSYAIQGRGTFLVKNISGSCSNVIGLPVNLIVQLLLTHGLITAEL